MLRFFELITLILFGVGLLWIVVAMRDVSNKFLKGILIVGEVVLGIVAVIMLISMIFIIKINSDTENEIVVPDETISASESETENYIETEAIVITTEESTEDTTEAEVIQTIADIGESSNDDQLDEQEFETEGNTEENENNSENDLLNDWHEKYIVETVDLEDNMLCRIRNMSGSIKYEIYYDSVKWEEAKSSCVLKNGNLIRFESKEEYSDVVGMLKYVFDGYEDNDLYLSNIYISGQQDIELGNDFKWIDSTGLSSEYKSIYICKHPEDVAE